MKKINLPTRKIFYTSLSVISLGILVKTYDYLKRLEKCECYHDAQAYNSLKIDIDFLKAYQVFEIFLVSMFIIIVYLCKSADISLKKKNVFSLTFLTSSVILLLTFVSGYISYNVFLLYAITKAKCKCLDKWQKYFLYVQGITGFMTFMRIMLSLIVVFLLTSFTHYS